MLRDVGHSRPKQHNSIFRRPQLRIFQYRAVHVWSVGEHFADVRGGSLGARGIFRSFSRVLRLPTICGGRLNTLPFVEGSRRASPRKKQLRRTVRDQAASNVSERSAVPMGESYNLGDRGRRCRLLFGQRSAVLKAAFPVRDFFRHVPSLSHGVELRRQSFRALDPFPARPPGDKPIYGAAARKLRAEVVLRPPMITPGKTPFI